LKILINTPDTSLPGGVANHYEGLRPYWKLNVHYNFIGGRKKIPGPLILPFDLIKFFFLCLFGNYDLVVLNPSLGSTAIKRDALFLKIASITKKKTLVFWHGWAPELVERINNNSSWFNRKYDSASMHLVLSGAFKKDLINWGIKSPIKLTTTKVDDRLIANFEIQKKQVQEFTILFLTRIEVYKGIFIVLEACEDFLKQGGDFRLVIAGEGSQLDAAKEYVRKKKLQNVHFLGNVSGEQLIQAFEDASIYILPSYSEGMPTSVLEAMAFGLPVITRPVGGINDFFEEGKMGYLVKSLNPTDFAEKISYMSEHPTRMKEIGEFNHFYAKKNFMASEVALKMEEFFKMILQKDFKEK
jgi:glycosyltransferase involved in cell wall biosynthesis